MSQSEQGLKETLLLPTGEVMRRWAIGYVAAILPLAVASFALPRYHLLLWGSLGWSASAAVVVGVVRNRPGRRLPWLLIALALAAFVTGDAVYDVLSRFLGYQDPFPSVADAFYLTTYPLLAFGLLGLVRVRRRERSVGPLLDALIVTASFAPPWIFVIAPYIHAANMTLFQKLVSIAYPCGDIAVLCMLARLVLADGFRNWSVRLLSLGAVGLLVADVVYGSIQLDGHWHVGGPTDVGWVLFYVCWGAASLHPSMRELTGTQPLEDKRLSPTTLVVLCGATLVAPGLLVWRAANGDAGGDVGLLSAASAVVFLMVMGRLTSLARAQAAQTNRERALREIGEGLVAASELETVDLEAVGAVESLVGSHVVACVVTVPEGRFERAVAAHPEALNGALFDLDGTGRGDNPLLPRLVSGGAAPGTARATEWNAFSFGGLNGVARRVMIGSAGSLPLEWSDLGDVLAAQLTLAADRVQLAEDLHQRKSEAKFRTLIRNASDVIVVVQANGEIRSETPSIEAVLGYDVESVGALRLTTLVHPDDGSRANAAIREMFDQTLVGPMRAEWRIRHADGRWLTMEVVGNDHSEDAEVGGAVLTMRDVSDRKVLEQELRHQAFHDSLTDLANRVLFNDRVDHALSRRSRIGNEVSVLLLDIDDFKVVNDTLGHPAGDDILVQFADRLLGCLRGEDTAARFGGDEFAVCVEVEPGQAVTAAAAKRILEAMAQPFRVADTDVNAQVSIGISVAGPATEGSTDMLREADLALYAAKHAGKGSFHFFEESLHEAVLARLEQRAELEDAIRSDQLRMHYQPMVSLSDGTMVGVEALVRWQHPVLGLIPPAEFTPLAEDSGLVVPLESWVLDRVCADLSRWQRQWNGTGGRAFNMAVNVSPHQLQAPDFLDVVGDTLRRHDIDPSWLTFEITENLLVQDSADVMTRLTALHDLGIALALDDFGAGYSSLRYLHRFPIQILKIDPSFVTGMGHSTGSDNRATVIDAIVSLANALDLQLVAEGIENESQRLQLLELGCAYGQGFHLGRPVPAESMNELIDQTADKPRIDTVKVASCAAEAALTRLGPGKARTGVNVATTSTSSTVLAEQVRRDSRWADLERLRSSHRMMDAVIEEVRGRRIRIGDHWLSDFASCNYLGFDLDDEIIDTVDGALRRWGTHPSWSRLLGNPRLYCDIEEQLTELLGAPDTLVLPTITHIHTSVIPALTAQGWVFVDSRAHKTIYDGAAIAAGQGAVLRRFRSDDGRDVDDLERRLEEVPLGVSRLVCMDGVNSMTGNVTDIAAFARVARAHDALLYVDDAHGFGLIGERGADEITPYGLRGNSIVRHAGETYDNVVLVGGFSKAYSSLLAFVALPTWLKNHLKVAAAPYLYSGPSPTASLATVLAGMQVNATRGESIRADLYRKTARVLDTANALGLATPNRSGLPIIELPLRHADDIDCVGEFLFDHGIYVTLAAYPLVSRREVGFRVQVTASNTDDQIEQLCEVLGELAERFQLKQTPAIAVT